MRAPLDALRGAVAYPLAWVALVVLIVAEWIKDDAEDWR